MSVLTSRTVVTTIEKANGMRLPANNQQQEGMNKNEKVVEGDLRAKTAEPAAWCGGIATCLYAVEVSIWFLNLRVLWATLIAGGPGCNVGSSRL